MAKPDDKIVVYINGRPIETFIDKEGIQRLPYNSALSCLCVGKFNALADFPVDERRQIYQNIGYSIDGYEEIFPDDKIENPLREKKRS
jgi:hypothetical protein